MYCNTNGVSFLRKQEPRCVTTFPAGSRVKPACRRGRDSAGPQDGIYPKKCRFNNLSTPPYQKHLTKRMAKVSGKLTPPKVKIQNYLKSLTWES